MAELNQNTEQQQNPVLRAAGVRTASAPTTVVIPEAQADTGAEKLPVPETKTPVPANSLPTMLDAIQQGIGVGTEYQREVIKSKTEEADLNSTLAVISKQLGVDKTIVDQQKRQATIKAERATLNAFEAGGGVDRLEQLQRGRRAAVDKMLKSQKVKEAYVEETGLIGSLRRLLFLGGAEEDAAVASETVAKYNNAIQANTRNANDIATTVDNMKLTETDATLAANARIFLKQAAAESTKFEIKAAETHAVAASQAVQMTNRNVDQRFKMFNMIEQNKEREDIRESRRLQRDQLAKSEENDDTFVAVVRRGYQTIGEPVADPTNPEAMAEEKRRILVSRATKGQAQLEVNAAFDKGAKITPATPSESFRAQLAINKTLLLDGKNRSLTFLNQHAQQSVLELEQSRVKAGMKGKTTDADKIAAIDNGVTAAWKRAEAQIDSGDMNNPNHAPPLGELLKKSPALSEHGFIKEVLLPLFSDPEAPVEDLSVEKILELGTANIKTKTHPERKYRFEEVNQAIGDIYKRAAVYNTDSQGRELRSFPLQTTYKVKLNSLYAFKFSPLSIGGFNIEHKDGIVDMTDDTERRQVLLRLLTRPEGGLSDLGPSLFEELLLPGGTK